MATSLSFGATQEDLIRQAKQAEDEDRIEDAIVLMQQAVALPGENLDDLCVSLEAYADVLNRQTIVPSACNVTVDPSIPVVATTLSSFGGSVTLDATAGLSQMLAVQNRYDETSITPSLTASIDWSLERGDFAHIIGLGLSSNDYIPLANYDPDSISTAALTSSYNITPSLSYTLLYGFFYAAAGTEMVLYQGYSPIIGFNVSSGTTLLRWGSQKWTLGGQSYQSMGYRDTYTIRTSWSRRVSEGLIASLSLGYALGIDTATTTSVAAGTYTDSLLFFSKAPTLIGKRNLEILNSSSKGPEASARIGYQGQNWQISLSLSVSQQTALKKDFWSMDTSDYYWNLDTNAYRIDSQKKFHAVIPITDSIDVDFLLSDGLITTDQANYLLTYAATHPGAVTSGNMKAIVEGKMDIRSYRQSYQKASLTLSLGMGLTDNVSMDLSTTYMQKIYQNMSVSHPLYYASLSRSLSALCGFTYDF